MPISNYYIKKILNYYRKETEYAHNEIDQMRYSLQTILWEIEKTIYLFLISLVLGFPLHFLLCALAIWTIRPLAGGFHASTPWRCFLFTLFGFILTFFATPLMPFNHITMMLVGSYSVLITVVATPIRSKQMESVASKSKDKQKKYRVTLITVVWFVCIFTKQGFFLAPFIMWIIFLQNVQLLIEYLRIKLQLR